MRRLVIRFKDLRHFHGKEVASVEEQVYDPEHPP
jgi:hypothetical protein